MLEIDRKIAEKGRRFERIMNQEKRKRRNDIYIASISQMVEMSEEVLNRTQRALLLQLIVQLEALHLQRNENP